MRTAILHTICSHLQVKGSLRFTALNIAYKCNASGIGHVAQRYLAKRTGLHVRTIRRHVQRLIAAGLLRLTREKGAWTRYQFLVPEAVHKRVADNLPGIIDRKRKPFTREEKNRVQRFLRWLDNPTGVATTSTLEHLRC